VDFARVDIEIYAIDGQASIFFPKLKDRAEVFYRKQRMDVASPLRTQQAGFNRALPNGKSKQFAGLCFFTV
jgi:hypothetical protein